MASPGLATSPPLKAETSPPRSGRGPNWAKQLAGPLWQALTVAFGVTVITFFMTRWVLDDPGLVAARLATQRNSPPAEIVAKFSHELGTDRPVLAQFGAYLWGLARADLGESYQYKELTVRQLVAAGLGTTLLVALLTIVLASAVGLALGFWTATHQSKWIDRALRLGATVTLSAPQAMVGLVLILVLSVHSGLLPAGGWGTGYPDNFRYLVMPVATLTLALAPVFFRVARQRALEVTAEGHVEAARSRGLGPVRVMVRHVLPNCAAPVVTAMAMGLGGLLSGAVIVEMVFGIPGVGHVLTDAIGRSDFPVIQAMTLVTGLAIVVCNAASEIASRVIDPRMR
ncbi:MAG: ABC transporter permease [Bifidobacteriaceae bacterium]|jgi:peptide/nickel transport system permease protein|nr:ABC transporter permease [Bifidobacteriaceae bacterium]